MSHPLSPSGGAARCRWQSIRDFIVGFDNHSSEIPPHLGCARFARHVLRRMEAQPFHGDPFQGPEIQLAGSQDRERLNLETMAVRGEKEVRETGGGRFCQDLWNPLFRQGVQDGQLFALSFIRDAGDGTDLQLFA
jgi:hypothetical protein